MSDKSKYHNLYQSMDPVVHLNVNDQMLFEIQVDQLDLVRRTYRQYGLDEPDEFPDLTSVYGYGKPPDLQVFEREVIPTALIELERQVRHELRPKNRHRDLTPVRRELKVMERFWEELDINQGKYADEIEWIRRMWYYRLFGKFLFINGKVTYITGVHWFFLNWWYLVNNILPQYRDRDRRWAIALKYCEVATTTFRHINEETGLPIPNEYGQYDMVDIGRRVFFGPNYPKARRVGDTSRIEAAMGEFVTRKEAAKCYIQGKDDENASTVFTEHFVQPFIKLPIFWKPVFDHASGLAPKNGILFDDLEDSTFGLHAILDFATSSDKAKLDGKFLHWFHFDEAGKLQRADCNDVMGVVKYCLATGAGSEIHGIAAATTTVDQIEDMSAGENYMRLCQRSHFNRRNSNGQTDSGLVNIFFKAEDGLEGYIGPYGESVIENPTPEQARYIGKTIGARKFIENTIASYRRNKDWQGLALFRRQHPQQFLDCFTPPPKNQVLRREIIEERLSFLTLHPEFTAVRGDFYWKGGVLDGEVGWRPDSDGRFYLSRNFLPGEINKKVFRDNMWWPAVTDRFVGSPDTFGVNVALGRKSNGGLVIHWRRDLIIDPLTRDDGLIESDRDIVTYSFRPDTVDEYCEDMIMAHVYCGAMCYPERNKTNVIDHFRRRGYGGYLLYDVDRNTGKQKPEPGWWNKNELVDASIRWLQDDVIKNIGRAFHPDLLKEYLEFGGRAFLTDYDLVASKLGTLIAEKNPYYSMVKNYNSELDCAGWVPWCDV